jgi:HAD superfamily hydrolase (TIGR01549 family)
MDLDGTLIDTDILKPFRDARKWQECYRNVAKTTIYPGLNKFLSLIQSHSFAFGIVTMSPRPYAERLLNYHRIKYSGLVCYHDCKRRKPYPDPMILCAKQMKVSPDRIIAIGDEPSDIIAAKSAGMVPIGVTWGKGQADIFSAAGTRYVCQTGEELTNLLLHVIKNRCSG